MAAVLWVLIISLTAGFMISLYCTCKKTYKDDMEQEIWIIEREERKKKSRKRK